MSAGLGLVAEGEESMDEADSRFFREPQTRQADPMTGFACVMRDDLGREFLAMQTFGDSRGKAKRAALAMNSRRIDARKTALEMLRVCEVGVRALEGQPPVDNRFVADGCELFGA